MPHKSCLEPSCGQWATYRGRCKDHAKTRDRSINRVGKSLYGTKRWAMLRRRKLYLNPLCEMAGCEQVATDVHHKHGVEADPWSLEGLESLCHSHHSRVTRQQQMRMA